MVARDGLFRWRIFPGGSGPSRIEGAATDLACAQWSVAGHWRDEDNYAAIDGWTNDIYHLWVTWDGVTWSVEVKDETL